MVDTSSDTSVEESIDTELLEAIDTAQPAAITDKYYLTLIKKNELKFPLQDYLDPGRTYSSRSAIRLPEINIEKSEFNLDCLILVRQNPFHGSPSEHLHNHIEKLEDMMGDDYNLCKLFLFSQAGDGWISYQLDP